MDKKLEEKLQVVALALLLCSMVTGNDYVFFLAIAVFLFSL